MNTTKIVKSLLKKADEPWKMNILMERLTKIENLIKHCLKMKKTCNMSKKEFDKYFKSRLFNATRTMP